MVLEVNVIRVTEIHRGQIFEEPHIKIPRISGDHSHLSNAICKKYCAYQPGRH
jgi:hypothetical protein